MLEDETGTAEIHIWDELINKVKNGTTYEFQNLNVKHLKGSTHLATTPATTFNQASKQLKSVQGPTLLQNPEKEVKVQMFKFLNNLSVLVFCFCFVFFFFFLFFFNIQSFISILHNTYIS